MNSVREIPVLAHEIPQRYFHHEPPSDLSPAAAEGRSCPQLGPDGGDGGGGVGSGDGGDGGHRWLTQHRPVEYCASLLIRQPPTNLPTCVICTLAIKPFTLSTTSFSTISLQTSWFLGFVIVLIFAFAAVDYFRHVLNHKCPRFTI